MSLPEVLLWQRLKGGQSGVRFRKQHPVGPYVVDFYCSATRTIVEIDGEVHGRADRPRRDAERDAFLWQNGYRVMHVLAADILRNADEAASSIAALAATPLHHQPSAGGPPPRERGGLNPPRHGEGDQPQAGGGGSPHTSRS